MIIIFKFVNSSFRHYYNERECMGMDSSLNSLICHWWEYAHGCNVNVLWKDSVWLSIRILLWNQICAGVVRTWCFLNSSFRHAFSFIHVFWKFVNSSIRHYSVGPGDTCRVSRVHKIHQFVNSSFVSWANSYGEGEVSSFVIVMSIHAPAMSMFSLSHSLSNTIGAGEAGIK